MTKSLYRGLTFGFLAATALMALACFGADDEPEPTLAPSAAATATVAAPEPTTSQATALPVAVTATTPPTPTLPPAAPIAWTDCPSGPFDCAEYDVPLDYGDPDGATIRLALRRLPAENPDERTGLLFVNPGGPGGSTIDILSGWARTLPSELRERFDVILFDPRGVGHSSPLLCHDNVQEMIGLNPYPHTDQEWQTIIDATRRFTEACAAAGRDILPHLGTRNAARDMDRLREASGEEAITYFGYSYGTTLGQVYADLFPTRVRAMVLDGGVDNALPPDDLNVEQIRGFEAAFQRYLAECAANQCIAGDPEETVRGLIDEAAAEPIPVTDGDRPVGQGELINAILGSLYSKATWSLLTAGFNAALDGDGDALLFLADSFAGREGDGEYSNLTEAHKAVNCLDAEMDPDPEHYIGLADGYEAQAPFFGRGAATFGFYCAFWEAEPEPLTAPRAAGAPPIIVIGTTGDPATPYKWSVALADQLESGVLLTRDGEGHLAYRYGNNCIDDAVEAYLLELTVPPEGLVCGDAGIEPVPPVPGR